MVLSFRIESIFFVENEFIFVTACNQSSGYNIGCQNPEDGFERKLIIG